MPELPVPRRRAAAAYAALGAVLGLGAVAFFWRVGSSSLFVDETSSWRAAAASLGGVFSVVRRTEVAPPTYYLLLHFWIGIVGDGESTMRLLSVLAGLALVAAVWWLGRLVGGSAAGGLAALLTALSPLVIGYAQEVRSYIFVMLAATVAVAAAIEATRRPDPRPWIALSAAASVATIWLHYTGLLVIVPLAWFIWTSRSLIRSHRAGHLAASAAALLIVGPLMVIQVRAGHQGGVAPYAMPTLTNFLRVLGTPFDGRFLPRASAYVTGAIATAAAVIAVGASSARERRLLVAAATLPVLVVTGISLAAKLFDEHTYYSLITRYTAVAAPFMAVSIALAVLELPRVLGVTLATVTAASLLSGLLVNYSLQTFQPNLHAAVARISSGYRPGDAVVFTGAAAHEWDPGYYVAQLRDRRPSAVILRTPGTTVAVPASATRVWVVADVGSQPGVSAALSSGGWHAISTSTLTPAVSLVLARH